MISYKFFQKQFKNTQRSLFILTVLLLLCQKTEPASISKPNLTQRLSKYHFQFSLDLYRELTKLPQNKVGTSSDNLVFSPYSAYLTLSMLFLGTSSSSNSSRQLRQALHFNSISYVDAHTAFREVARSLAEDRYYGRKVKSANALFLRGGAPVSPHYSRALTEYYRSRVERLDFRNTDPAETEGVINDWVSDVTEGDISRMLDLPPPTDTSLLVVNALAMSAKWLFPFNPDETFEKGLFFLPGEERLEVPMMSGRFRLSLGHSSKLEARVLELPFTQRRISLFILLPDETDLSALGRLEANMTTENVREIISTLKDESVNVRLPRFRVFGEANVSTAVRDGLGVKDLFNPQTADLRLMTDKEDVVLTDIKHKAYFEVKENGARGNDAANESTQSDSDDEGNTSTSTPSSPFGHQYFEVDHPFVFLVWDYYSGMVLLMGRVVTPDVITSKR